MLKLNTDVLIIGAGPAGLAAALQLSESGVEDVIVVDRDKRGGGVPQLCNHLGFGVRDRHRVFSGPAYAKSYIKKIEKTGVKLLTETTVTELVDKKTVSITTPEGIKTIAAKAILLATGCRERPRTARLIPGYRPQGIYNTGSLQDFVHGFGRKVGNTAVIVGAELVSYSAIHTLHKGGCAVKLMTTEYDDHQIYAPYTPYKWWSADLLTKIPLEKNTVVSDIYGKKRVGGVELTNLKTGKKKKVDCDTLVLTGDWIPDHEIARSWGIKLDKKTKGPAVDGQFRTSKEGVFAAGNVLRGAEPGDIAAIEGKYAAMAVVSYLKTAEWRNSIVKIEVDDPLQWISPNVLETNGDKVLMNRFLFRVNDFVKDRALVIRQEENILFKKAFKKIGPNYSKEIRGDWVKKVSSTGNIKVTLD